MVNDETTAEHHRLRAARHDAEPWKLWGPYLSERAWSTVREDYSADGSAWTSFPHDHARSRVYRWNEDGLAGICDKEQRLCFAIALWNGQDPILKERLFGLSGPEGNHGEDVKECYYYLDSTPTHSALRMLYKYPQRPFPYADLVDTNRSRSREQPEYELRDTGIFDDDRYFDVLVEYAKAAPEDIGVRISVTNCGPDAATLDLLPTLWFRNTWNWGDDVMRPLLYAPAMAPAETTDATILAEHATLGRYALRCDPDGLGDLLFTENETNQERIYGAPNPTPYVKDGIGDAVVGGLTHATNPARHGTKAAAHYRLSFAPGQTRVVRLRLRREELPTHELDETWLATHDALFALRATEADAFYDAIQPADLDDDRRAIQRQAFAGMLWSKQFYHYDVARWLSGDPGQPPPPPERLRGRNSDWPYFNTSAILSMPDAWEYPWFAAWDLAFHCIPLALLDSDFAKQQLILLGREWYQQPNGQTPAYEWAFGDVNPPVLAWAAWRVYKIEQKQRGVGDMAFLERVFHKLMLNFTWWVNRKDAGDRNVFQGGFLGLDNIGVFDRSKPLPGGGHIEQSDGTAWMGMFSLNMLTIALELAQHNRVYEDIASKFFEHFLYIAAALNSLGDAGQALWDDDDEFFYDVLHIEPDTVLPIKIRSMVGLIPLLASTTLEPDILTALPNFAARLDWFLTHRPEIASLVSRWQEQGRGERHLLALCRGHRMKRVLRRMLDEAEFLSPYGIRSLSRVHAAQPYTLEMAGMRYTVAYLPGESDSGLFGGNSNWRGPVWFPINYLLIETLQQFHHYYGDDFRIEHPTGSGQYLTLRAIADDLSQRLIGLFARDDSGRRPMFGGDERLQRDPRWRDHILFHEYFHGETGAGLGASHQTGWTGLVAKLIQQQGDL